ncbi:8341_t:CDS:2 [Rhizophagus irregularis]|nr:8341_t:CDS:2 [Rhizophagus irregularis]
MLQQHDENPSKDENDDDTKNDKFNKIINKIFKIINRIETKFLLHSEVNQLESESLPLADINLIV